jgi:predicted porin
MKRIIKVVTIGMGMACAAAHAQSSVTLYGLQDVGIEYKNQVPTAGRTQSSLVQMQSGNMLGNRWGMTGSEDLGGGLRLIFTLENGFTINNGVLSQGGREFGRKSFVGFRTKWGDVTFGRQNNLVYEHMQPYDPALFAIYSASTYDAFLVARMDNSVKYAVSGSGFFFGSMYSTGYDSTIVNGAQVPGASKVGREYEMLGSYNVSGFSAAVAFDQMQGTSIVTQDNALQRVVAGVSYKLGQVSASAGFRWLNGQNGASAMSSNLYWGGLSYQVNAAFSVAAGGYHAQMRQTHNGPSSGVLYADYFVSKSTDFYALFSHVWNAANTNLGIDGQGQNTAFGVDQTGVILGIRHTF